MDSPQQPQQALRQDSKLSRAEFEQRLRMILEVRQPAVALFALIECVAQLPGGLDKAYAAYEAGTLADLFAKRSNK